VNINDIVTKYQRSSKRLLLLDYDGVLAPIMPLPEQAVPTAELRDLFKRLAHDADCVVVSGRDHATLQEWLGDLPLAFAAEHGLWRKDFDGRWLPTISTEAGWKDAVTVIMERYVAMLPGSFVEEKAVALAFHYRNVATPDVDEAVGRLMSELEPLLAASSLRILHGKKVVEVLPGGVNKGEAARFWVGKKTYDFILAAGDDVTDESLFQAMPAGSCTVKVGEGLTAAKYRVGTQADFMDLLRTLPETS